MRTDSQLVAVTRAGKPLAIMAFVTREERNDGPAFEREATDDAIEAEIERAGLAPYAKWRRVSRDELPEDRATRSTWRDDGNGIVVA